MQNNKFKILTFNEFMDEHLNESPEKLAYRNYVDNVHAANILSGVMDEFTTFLINDTKHDKNIYSIINGIEDRTLIFSKDIRNLKTINLLLTVILVLTWVYMLGLGISHA